MPRLSADVDVTVQRVLAGSGLEDVFLDREHVHPGLEKRVHFLGPLQDTDLVKQFVKNQIMALPSSYEGFGIVYLEGMAFGLPALATTAGGAVEIITSGRDGFLVTPGDIGALASHLRRLMEDRDLLLAMSLAAQKRFAVHPTWEEAGNAVYRFLSDHVLGSKT